MSDAMIHTPHLALRRLVPLIPSITRQVTGGRYNLAGVQINPEGWLSVSDGHQIYRTHLPGRGRSVREDLALDGLKAASKTEKSANWFLGGESIIATIKMPDFDAVVKTVKLGDYVAWGLNDSAAKLLENSARHIKAAWLNSRAAYRAKHPQKRLWRNEPKLSLAVVLMPNTTTLQAKPWCADGYSIADRIGGPRVADDTAVGIDARYLATAIKAFRNKRGVEILLHKSDPYQPIVVRPIAEDTQAIIMPCRL